MILSVNSWAPALYLTLATSDSHNQEALIRATEPNMLHVDYDIVLSPTYQVPALYFTLRWTNHQDPVVGIDGVYRYLVPEQYRKQLKSVGIMGGISFDVGACVFDSRTLQSSRS